MLWFCFGASVSFIGKIHCYLNYNTIIFCQNQERGCWSEKYLVSIIAKPQILRCSELTNLMPSKVELMINRKKKAKELNFHVQLTSSKVSLIWKDNGKLTSNKKDRWWVFQDGLFLFQSMVLHPCSLHDKGAEGEEEPLYLPALNFPRRLEHNPSWALKTSKFSSFRTNSLTLHLPWK